MVQTTVADVVRHDLCMGCGTCVALCPTQAVRRVRDYRRGIHVVVVDADTCNGCGICLRVCPGHAVDVADLADEFTPGTCRDDLLGRHLDCWMGYAAAQDLRYRCASGGLVTSLLLYTLAEGLVDGVLVSRMPHDGSLQPEPFVARSADDIVSAARSIYCPVPANVAVREILRQPGRYAVVGIPCHLHGIRKAERISKRLRRRIVLHLGLFCAWGTPFTGTEYALQRMGLKPSQVQSVDYRGEGWPGWFTVRLKNGQIRRQTFRECWDRSLGAFKPYRCTVCHDHTAELADISFGDAWLPEVTARDSCGTSICITRNRPGQALLAQMTAAGAAALVPLDRRRVAQSQKQCAWKKTDIAARIRIARLMGWKVPDFGVLKFPQSRFDVLAASAFDYLQSALATRRCLWHLLRLSSRAADGILRLRKTLTAGPA